MLPLTQFVTLVNQFISVFVLFLKNDEYGFTVTFC